MDSGPSPPPPSGPAPGGAPRPATATHAGGRGGSRGDGELAAAVARGTVRICRAVTGRGPTKAQAFCRDNIFVVVLQETQTRAEKSLIARGDGAAVLRLRERLQDAMRDALIAMVEELTGRPVVALLGASHLQPDYTSEVFVLDRAPAPGAGAPPDVSTSTAGERS